MIRVQPHPNQLTHVARQRRLERHLAVENRMIERKFPRMEHLPGRNRRKPLVKRALAINLVACNRHPQRSHVNTDLMRAPRFNSALHRRKPRMQSAKAVGLSKHPPICHGEFAVFIHYRHSLAVDRMTPDQILDPAGKNARTAVAECKIGLLHG